ncbi:hypothetical protein MMYC01_202634 [Madurella mycetomatis]|uniref:Uncharacterized protein n=1 Tax=Madurella mycetomatis TaxID=100816 RepID=A0A175WCK1_9PEZI|nr:hypothetical protein MMYC01_202634 [Madurella mycetomatis]
MVRWEAQQGVVFASKIAGLVQAAEEVDNCGFDVETEIRRLRLPASLGTPGFSTGLDPFLGAGPVWIKGGDRDAGMERHGNAHRGIGNIYVPCALPCTSYSYGENWMSTIGTPHLRWVDNGNGAAHLVDENLYRWFWREKKLPSTPTAATGSADSATEMAQQSTNATVDLGATGIGVGRCVPGGQGGLASPMEDKDLERREWLQEAASRAARRVLYLDFFSHD